MFQVENMCPVSAGMGASREMGEAPVCVAGARGCCELFRELFQRNNSGRGRLSDASDAQGAREESAPARPHLDGDRPGEGHDVVQDGAGFEGAVGDHL